MLEGASSYRAALGCQKAPAGKHIPLMWRRSERPWSLNLNLLFSSHWLYFCFLASPHWHLYLPSAGPQLSSALHVVPTCCTPVPPVTAKSAGRSPATSPRFMCSPYNPVSKKMRDPKFISFFVNGQDELLAYAELVSTQQNMVLLV